MYLFVTAVTVIHEQHGSCRKQRNQGKFQPLFTGKPPVIILPFPYFPHCKNHTKPCQLCGQCKKNGFGDICPFTVHQYVFKLQCDNVCQTIQRIIQSGKENTLFPIRLVKHRTEYCQRQYCQQYLYSHWTILSKECNCHYVRIQDNKPALFQPPRPFPFHEGIEKIYAPTCLYRHEAERKYPQSYFHNHSSPLNSMYCRFTCAYLDFGTEISFPVVRVRT